MKRTLAVWGLFGVLVLAQVGALLLVSPSALHDNILLLIAANTVILAFAVWIDSFGLLCMLLGWLPLSGLVEFEIGIITFTAYTLGMIGLLVVTIYKILRGIFSLGAFEWSLVLLGMSYLIGTVTSENIVGTGFIVFHALFIPIVSYFVIRSMTNDESAYKRLLLFMVAGIVAFAIYALVVQGISTRLVAAKVSPISAAAMFTTAIILLIGTGWWKNLYGMAALPLLLVGLYATYSRGYLVLLLVAPVFYRIIRKGHAQSLMILMLVTSLIGTVVLAYNAEMLNPGKVDSEGERGMMRITNLKKWQQAIYVRGHVYRIGLDNFPNNPLFGRGMHRTHEINVRHNFHVEWLEYGGLAGYILYSTILIVHFRRMKRQGREDPFVAASLLAIFMLLVNGLTNSFTVGISTYLVFILMALNEARRVIYRKELNSREKQTHSLSGVTGVGIGTT